MYGVSRLDYSRLRELRYPLYGLLIVLDHRRARAGQATRGAKRWIPLPGFNLQPSELGKVLLVVALSGFLVDAMREMGRHTTARVMLLGAVADDDRHGRAGPRLGARSTSPARSRCCSSPGRRGGTSSR